MKTFQELKQYALDHEPDYYRITKNYTIQICSNKQKVNFHEDTNECEKHLCTIFISDNEDVELNFPRTDLVNHISSYSRHFSWSDDINVLMTLKDSNAQLIYELLKLL